MDKKELTNRIGVVINTLGKIEISGIANVKYFYGCIQFLEETITLINTPEPEQTEGEK